MPGHQYRDVDATIVRSARGNWSAEILETWGSAQGRYDEEHGRKKVCGSGSSLSEAVSDARQRAQRAGIDPKYTEEALSEAESEAWEEIESDMAA